MYFLGEVTELGKESIYISDKEVCRRIVYNQPINENNEGYQILYSEDYNTDKGLDYKVELLTKDDTYTMYTDHLDNEELNCREIDTDNLVEFCVNIMDTKSIPSGMSVTEGCPMEVSLYGNNDTIKDFQFIPEKDGTVFHLKDTMMYTNYIVSEKLQNKKFSEHPIFYQDNMLAKVVYTGKALVNRDYNIPNEVLVFDNANLIMDIKYDRVTEVVKDNYKLTRPVQVYSKVRHRVTDQCLPTDTFNINKYSKIKDLLGVESGTSDKVIIEYDEPKQFHGRVKNYTIVYPIHYISILGNIFTDELNYNIFTEEEIIFQDGNLKYHNISYHKLDKYSMNLLHKFYKY